MGSIVHTCAHYYLMDAGYVSTLNLCNLLLTIVFNIEAAIKIVALREDYYECPLHKLDFMIVLLNDVALILDIFVPSDVPRSNLGTLSLAMKFSRIFRVIRLLRSFKNLRVALDSLSTILPSLVNVGSLMMLMFFIFAIIGMNMFSGVKH